MRYTLISRKQSIRAKSNTEFITWMRKCDPQMWKCNRSFMAGYSYRKLTFEKLTLDYQNENAFIKSLEKNYILEIKPFRRRFWNFLRAA